MFEQLRQYIRSFLLFARHRAYLAVGLIFCATLLEGIGILILIPVLQHFSRDQGIAGPSFLSDYMDRVNDIGQSQQLALVLLVFLVLYLVRMATVWMRDLLLWKLSVGYVDHWRKRLFRALGDVDWKRATTLARSEFEHAVNNDVVRLGAGTDRFLRGVVSITLLLTQVAIAFWLSPRLTAIIVLFSVIMLVFLVPLAKRGGKIGQSLSTSGKKAHKILGDFFSGLKLAKAQRVEQLYVEHFERQIEELQGIQYAFLFEQSLARSLFQFSSAIFVCAIIWIGFQYLEMQFSYFVVLLIIFVRLTGPFYVLIQGGQSFAHMLPAFTNLNSVEADLLVHGNTALRGRSEIRENSKHDGTPIGVEFENVRYGYRKDEDSLLANVTFKIRAGEFVEIAGQSGVGKTTLVDLMIGLLTPIEGTIRLDGIEVSQYSVQNEIAYVGQDTFLFNRTIRENLLWPNVNRDDTELWEALEASHIADYIKALPERLDTVVGERGTTLSGGERQRICFARALLRRPRLLVLDEATNALDSAHEEKLRETLRQLRGKTTVVSISHRPEVLPLIDKRILVADGEVKIETKEG